MRITKLHNKTLVEAEAGMTLVRKSDNWIAGERLYLAYTWFINGERLEEPHLEVPEDYEEIPYEVEEEQ